MPLLGQPGRIGRLELPNRAVFPPMLMNYASDRGEVTERLVAYYRSLARGGYGLIVTECIFPQFKGGIATRGLAFYDDRFMPGFTRLVGAVHEEGALLGAQIFFDGAGRIFASEETVSIGPSDLAPFGGPSMREMTEQDLEIMATDFADAAARAKACGADLVELHMGHAHLLGRFASPYWNRRTDAFGGDRTRRMRFPLMVLERVRAAVGADMPVTARLCLTEQIDGGIDLAEAIAIGKVLKQAGIDAVHTSAGSGTTPRGLASIFPTSFAADAPFAPMAKEFRRETGLTTIFAGKVRRHDIAERLLEDGTADFVSAGRAGLADPAWPRGEHGATPCIGCNQGCTDSLITRKEIVCTVNPALGFEHEFGSVGPLPTGVRCVVIGAGPAGITCALGLAERGVAVTLMERGGRIGGAYAASATVPGKELYGTYLDHLARRLEASGVEVMLNADDAAVRRQTGRGAHVFWAGGSSPRGWDSGDATVPVVSGWDLFFDPSAADRPGRVFVVGAGQTGCDAAIFLSARGHAVTLCDRQDTPLSAFRARQYDYQSALERNGVEMLFGTDAERAEGADVVTRGKDGTTTRHQTDSIFIAVGREPLPLPDYARGAVRLGDAAKVGSALEAIRQGTFHAAFADLR
ncbi:MAG: FAD-dependent oxidoreductase [Rhizobiaceae bacterium]|nr:FAD-dependent oxidoreductase [Rhizobiaceae bacterium]